MTADSRTLVEVFREAAGDRESLKVSAGEVRLDGQVLSVDGKDLNELGSFEVEALARELREAADGRFASPSSNPLILTDPVD